MNGDQIIINIVFVLDVQYIVLGHLANRYKEIINWYMDQLVYGE